MANPRAGNAGMSLLSAVGVNPTSRTRFSGSTGMRNAQRRNNFSYSVSEHVHPLSSAQFQNSTRRDSTGSGLRIAIVYPNRSSFGNAIQQNEIRFISPRFNRETRSVRLALSSHYQPRRMNLQST